MPLPDTVLVTYGLLSGGARLVVPPLFDIPFVNTVRGAMFDRLARDANVTLTAEARRTLVDLDRAVSSRGAVEQAARWAANRFLPGATAVDAGRNAVRTYAAGALFQRLLARRSGTSPVIDAREADQIANALRPALAVLNLDHVRALARMAMTTGQHLANSQETSLVQRYGDAIVSTVADLPMAWLDVLESEFKRRMAGDFTG